MSELPRQARAVVIGGGIIGCSVAYHLAKLGWKDVLLLERKRLTSGTTWHAAGLIAVLRGSSTLTKIAKYSAELMGILEAETELSTGYRRTGSVSVALSRERLEEIRRQGDMGKAFGVDTFLMTPAETRERYPLLSLEGVEGGLWIPANGQADPANVALAMAKAARQRGVAIHENTAVTGILRQGARVAGVKTEHGEIKADVVVNCAGMWARDVGRMAGANVPLMGAEHFYVVTNASPDIPRNLPVLRVPDECAYVKEDAGKLLVGFFEPKGKPFGRDGIPADAEFLNLPEDWEHLARELELASHRLPILQKVGIHTFFNGPESFTHDGRWMIGEAPELAGMFVAAGFNSIGIQTGGGAGKALAEWIEAGGPTMDLTGHDIRRAQPFHGNKTYLATRISETLGLHYADQFPYRHFESARGLRHSPLHERLASLGAVFGEGAGWERPYWFLPEAARKRGATSDVKLSWGRQAWFPYAAAEHTAVRTACGLFDLTPFGKIRVEGPDAEAVLQKICANDVAVPVGRIVYTPWLNGAGGIEADLTVTRLSETLFMVVTSSGTVARDLAWIRRHTPPEARCVATDVTSAEACLAIMGPKAREVLSAVIEADLSNERFPYGTAQDIEIGMVMARAHRVSYVGELGWELYVPTDMARHVLDTLMERAGSRITHCGMHVLDSCRIEKAFRHYGHDISSVDHVLEAGLGFAVKVNKPAGRYGAFIGREGVLRKREAGLSARMVQFKLTDPEPLLLHDEPILRDGEVVGYLTSGAYGHHLGASIGLGYVRCRQGEGSEALLASRYELLVAGKRCTATASLTPLYDPRAERVRA